MTYTKEQIQRTLAPVFNSYHIRKATLFGSYAKNSATDSSDVDICVDSGLKGMKFVGLIESIRNALGGKDVDLLDTTHIEEGSAVYNEINHTGVVIYEG